MQAIHGGQAHNDPIAAQNIAGLLRGGMRPQASVSPAEMRATRALLRRRLPLARKRGERLAHVHHTNRQYTLLAMGKNIAYTRNRDGVAERCADPAVHKSIAGALALLTDDDALRRAVERPSVHTAKPHDAPPLYRLQTVPGLGTSLRRVLLDDSQQIDRFPRVPDVAAYGRLVKGAKASAGQRSGTSGTTIGHAPLPWACSKAAVLCRREQPAGQQCLTRLEKKHRQGKAWTI